MKPEVFNEQFVRSTNRPDRLRKLEGWATVAELAAELQFTVTAPVDPAKACRAWLVRVGVQSVRRGRVILVDRRDVDHVLRKRDAELVLVRDARGRR